MRYFGWWRSLRELADACWNALLELLPSRRKTAFGDLDYDWEHSVDTTRSNVGMGTQFLAGVIARPYFATEPWLFQQIMDALALSIQPSAIITQPSQTNQSATVINGLENFTFVDLGSGKGRVLLMAAPYGFKKIIGVEYMPEWHKIAEENIRKFVTENKINATIQSLCMDARDFDFPAGPLVVYLFNPFPEPVLAAVLDRLRQSLLRNPRHLFVVYRYLEFEHLLANSGWLERVAEERQWAAYQVVSRC